MPGEGQREGGRPNPPLGPRFHQITHLAEPLTRSQMDKQTLAPLSFSLSSPETDANEPQWPKGR